MSIRIQADTTTQGVSRNWFADSRFGTLNLGCNGHANHLYFDDPADIDAVIAELIALRAEMTGEPARRPANPPHHVTGRMPGVICHAEDGGYTCNAQDGHDGPDHVAYVVDDKECHRWPVGGHRWPVGGEPFAYGIEDYPGEDGPMDDDAELRRAQEIRDDEIEKRTSGSAAS